MRQHAVVIWRNPDTKLWHHRFVSSNGKELGRQSEGVTKRATAIRSATIAYHLEWALQATDGAWFVARPGVQLKVIPARQARPAR